MVEYPDKLLLLDGGCYTDLEIIENFVAHLGRSLKDLKVVVVTHMHPDHAGGAERLRELYGSAIVTYASRKNWYSGMRGYFHHGIDILLAHWVAHRLGRPWKWLGYSRILRPNFKVKEGDCVPFFPDWKIIFTPGHTDHDISLVHEEAKIIYVADLLLRIRERYNNPFPITYPNLYKQSLEKIQSYSGFEALLAHGGRVNLSAADIKSFQGSFVVPKKRAVILRILKSFFLKAKKNGKYNKKKPLK